ncbi:adenylate kinase [Synchytrium microbalum]|uniref:Adenylate kinase isoenzyme 6 homolog n=1 Tax=Synchytrium microbalum TaxID=1806994 RepID=A0A507C800_9FUNG|nr:adenylate kinase [Synchytrium microbalum]TPX33625.1 adenylate kinase [Synchytrium microbalum]
MTNSTILRTLPNILVTGTPGTGKTTFSAQLAAALTPPSASTGTSSFTHKNISQLVAENSWHSGYDERWQSYLLDEDQVVDGLEPVMGEGGIIIDYHGCDFFPERWFDLVIVLRAQTSVLYDRLHARKYPKHKIEENITSEIMNVIHDEAFDSYKPECILVLESNTEQDLQSNLASVSRIVAQYQPKQVMAAPTAKYEDDDEESNGVDQDDEDDGEDLHEYRDESNVQGVNEYPDWPKPIAGDVSDEESEEEHYMEDVVTDGKRKRA